MSSEKLLPQERPPAYSEQVVVSNQPTAGHHGVYFNSYPPSTIIPPPEGGPYRPTDGIMVRGTYQPYHGVHSPMVHQPGSGGPVLARNWHTGLCQCCSDLESCCLVTWAGTCVGMMMFSELGESACLPLCMRDWPIMLRTLYRKQNNIPGTVMDDCLTMTFCCCCGMCQMSRDSKYRPY